MVYLPGRQIERMKKDGVDRWHNAKIKNDIVGIEINGQNATTRAVTRVNHDASSHRALFSPAQRVNAARHAHSPRAQSKSRGVAAAASWRHGGVGGGERTPANSGHRAIIGWVNIRQI